MRSLRIILPLVLAFAGCAKVSEKLSVRHNLKARTAQADEATMSKIVGDGKCLNLRLLRDYLRGLGQVSMTAYVSDLGLRDEASTDKKPIAVDSKTIAKQLQDKLNPPVLLENFTGNTLDRSKLLEKYLPSTFVQDEDCTEAGLDGKLSEFSIEGAVAAQDEVALDKKSPTSVATPIVKHRHSATRNRLDLRQDGRLISYYENGTVLTITIDETLPDSIKTCDNSDGATLNRHTEIVLDHSDHFENASVSRSFAQWVNEIIDPKSLPKKIVDAGKAKPARGFIELSEPEMGTLETAILAGHLDISDCKTKADGQSR